MRLKDVSKIARLSYADMSQLLRRVGVLRSRGRPRKDRDVVPTEADLRLLPRIARSRRRGESVDRLCAKLGITRYAYYRLYRLYGEREQDFFTKNTIQTVT